jgi:hypothetical protein
MQNISGAPALSTVRAPRRQRAMFNPPEVWYHVGL